jgi:hypothetical protein
MVTEMESNPLDDISKMESKNLEEDISKMQSELCDEPIEEEVPQESHCQRQTRISTGEIFKVTNPDTPFPLEKLPPELRLMIYEEMLDVDVPNLPFGRWKPFTYVSEFRQWQSIC